MDITRRNLLRRGGLLALGTAGSPRTAARLVFRTADQAARGDVLIVVFARGGYDALNIVIPYGNEAEYFALRPTIGIPAPDSTATRKATDLDGFFGMHPTLVDNGWKARYDQGVLAIVHAMHMQHDTRSHFDAMDYMERGTPGRKSLQSGWLGRHLATLAAADESPFRAVGMGTMLQLSLRGPVPAVVLQSIADFRLQARASEAARFEQSLQAVHAGDGWLDQAGRATFAAVELLAREVGSSTYVPANGASYDAAGGFGRSLLQVAQLIRADIGLEAACVDIGGWDTHADEVERDDPTTGKLANLLGTLSGGLAAFMTDLAEHFDPADRTTRGVTVVVMSEFGRRAAENGGVGTDHGHGSVMFLFGKGVRGGKVYTNPWPGLAANRLDRGDLAGTTEYRDILGEILEKRLGNWAVDRVFPDWSFNFLDLAELLDVLRPTATPSRPATMVPTTVPTGAATRPPPEHALYLPLAERGG